MFQHYPGGGRRSPLTATVLMVVIFFAAAVPTRAAVPTVLINEIMWDETEYIELKNTTDEKIELSNWNLTRQQASSTAKTIVTFADGDEIAAQGYFLIEKNDSASEFTANKTVSALTLVNTGELLVLTNNEGAVVDSANQLGMWYAGENTDAGVAMERTTSTDGTLASSWHTATTTNGGRVGTPGGANSTPAVNTPPQAVLQGPTTGKVKEILSFNAEDSTDPENDELTFAWSFGEGAAVTSSEATHAYAAPGTYTVRLTVSDGEHETETTRTITITVPEYSSAIIINEILPNPVGSDTANEFIELRNTSDTAVDISGWQLDDAAGGSTPYTIPSGTTVPANSIVVWYRSETKLALNNDADSARLLDPAGATKASATYAKALAEGYSYNLPISALAGASNYAVSTTSTPGRANTITAPVSDDDEDEEDTAEPTTKSTSKAGKVAGSKAVSIPLADVREEEPGTTIQTEGVVSAPPGVLGKNIFYVAGSGIQVYASGGDFPAIKLGDTVQLTGELSSNRGEARLKVATADAVKKTKSAAPPTPHQVATGEIDEAWEGSLVIMQGHVIETSGDTFFVDDDSGEVKVSILTATHIDKPKMKKGDAVTITGIVSETTTGYRVLPRFQEDIRLGLVAGLTSFPATGASRYFLNILSAVAAGLFTWAQYRREPLLRVGIRI